MKIPREAFLVIIYAETFFSSSVNIQNIKLNYHSHLTRLSGMQDGWKDFFESHTASDEKNCLWGSTWKFFLCNEIYVIFPLLNCSLLFFLPIKNKKKIRRKFYFFFDLILISVSSTAKKVWKKENWHLLLRNLMKKKCLNIHLQVSTKSGEKNI